jgi:ketosteroid isomerase-like protein
MHSKPLGAAALAALLSLTSPAAAHEASAAAAPQTLATRPARGAADIVDAFHAALKRGDTVAAAALLAEDALIFEEGGAERSKAEYAAHHLPSDAQFSRSVSSVVSRRAGHSQGALAWIATEGRTTGSYKGKPVDLSTAETMVLRRSDGTWKIVHIHWSSAAKQ